MEILAFRVLSAIAFVIGFIVTMSVRGSGNPTWGLLGLLVLFAGLAGLVVSLMMGMVESTVTKQHEKAAILTKRKIESIFESQTKEVSGADPLNIRDSLPDPLNVRGKLNRK
jgi:hypothetical protein